MGVLKLCFMFVCWSSYTYAQYDLNGQDCGKEWQFTVETSKTGATVTGIKSRLIDGVRQGARVRLYVGEWGANGYSAEADNVHVAEDGNVCVQLLQSVSKNGWDRFQDNAYWWWTFVCTSGHTHMTRYNVGAHTFRGETRAKVSVKWFVKYPGPKRVAFYKNNAGGERLGGALFSVANEVVKNGADVRGVSDGGSYSFALENLHVPVTGEYIAGQSLAHISTSGGNVASFQTNAYHWFTTVSTDGTRDMSRWSVGAHVDRGHSFDNEAYSWFVDGCWKLVYTNGERGEGLFGAREDLVKEIKSGKRVRVMTQHKETGSMYITNADFTWVRNGHVTVQNLGHVSKANAKTFQDNAYWFWQMKSTTGRVTNVRYNVGESVHRGTNTERMTIHWYVETRPWNQVYSHDKDGNVLDGKLSELVSAVKGGASAQIVTQGNQDEFSSFPAHNLALMSLPTGMHVAAQNVKHVSVRNVNGSCFEYEIQQDPYWWFSIVTTEGKRDMLRYTVGKHEPRGHNQDTVALNWFVNI